MFEASCSSDLVFPLMKSRCAAMVSGRARERRRCSRVRSRVRGKVYAIERGKCWLQKLLRLSARDALESPSLEFVVASSSGSDSAGRCGSGRLGVNFPLYSLWGRDFQSCFR
jgi:hypothetical protein